MKTFQFLKRTFALLFLSAICYASASAQTSTVFSGVTKQNDMLVFQNQAAFETVLNQLRQNVENYDYSSMPDEQPTNAFLDPMPALASFEQSLGFTSWRKTAELKVFNEALRGNQLEIQDELFSVDEILGSMFSADRLIQIGTDIYYIESELFNYKFINGTMAAVNLIREGASPLQVPGVVIYRGVNGPDAVCNADFYPNGFGTSVSGAFLYSGSPGVNEVTAFNWYFGDGTSSTSPNPTHTFPAYGTYNVCLQITTKDGCTSQTCKTIEISASNTCQAGFIFNKTGQPGGVAFKDLSSIVGSGQISSWAWNFGDGSPINSAQNPTHTFPCDKRYIVTLTITTATGCTSSFFLPVEISSYNCCDRNPKVDGTRYYDWNGKKYRMYYEAKHVNLPLARYVHTTIRHSRKGLLGIYWWSKARLLISLRGRVYKADERGCFCQSPFTIDGDKSNYTFWLIMDKNVGNELLEPFKAKKTDPWNCTFKVTDRNITEYHVAQISCD